MANALSVLRLLSAVPFALAMAYPTTAAAAAAAGLLLLAIATDLLDGPIARSRGTSSALGGVLDHTADFAFVSAGLGAMALREAVPPILPLLIVLAFAQYVVDSFVLHREKQLRMSRLGRSNGILYFVPLVGDALARLWLPELGLAVRGIAWLLALTTLLSMVDRLLALPRPRGTAPDSHGEGKVDRSSR